MESGNFEGGKLEAAHCKLQGLPSMCGGDAAFCQINLTTCYYEQLGGRNFLVNVASRCGNPAMLVLPAGEMSLSNSDRQSGSSE